VPKLIPEQKIALIKELRRTGHSIPEISIETSLPKSSVFRYIQGVDINKDGLARLNNRRRASTVRKNRLVIESVQQATAMITNLSKNEISLITASLYWAEGAKKDFSFANTDPEMVRLFINSLRSNFNVTNEEITISIRLYEDLDKNKAIDFWSNIVGFPLVNNVHINLLKGKKQGKLPYGMCRVRVRKASKLHKLMFSIIKRMIDLTLP